MKSLEAIFNQFRKKGVRLTSVRKAVVSVLAGAGKPLCVADIVGQLAKRGLSPNKTTVYREIDFLIREGWIHGLDFGDSRKCYEWVTEHHHHLVCRKCERVEEVGVDRLEPAFAEFEKGLMAKTRFSNLSHSLEFYGICNRCCAK